jgi:hypothetical protein
LAARLTRDRGLGLDQWWTIEWDGLVRVLEFWYWAFFFWAASLLFKLHIDMDVGVVIN